MLLDPSDERSPGTFRVDPLVLRRRDQERGRLAVTTLETKAKSKSGRRPDSCTTNARPFRVHAIWGYLSAEPPELLQQPGRLCVHHPLRAAQLVPGLLGRLRSSPTNNDIEDWIGTAWYNWMYSITASINGTTNICSGNSTTLTAIGGGTYLWNTLGTTASIIVNPSSNTSYSVTVSSGAGCNAIAIVTVTVNAILPAPTAGINVPSQTQIIWNWNTVNGATGYKWSTTTTYGSAITRKKHFLYSNRTNMQHTLYILCMGL